MKTLKYNILFLLLFPLLSFSQQVENVRFEQVGKKIHIYYDLQGNGTYNVSVFCSTDNGQTWGEPLQMVTGAVGKNQQPGSNKEIIWNVLAEREKLTGEIVFKVEASSGNTGTFTDTRDGQTYKWVKIGDQIWMAENLNYNTGNSWCYDNDPANCDVYGRLYDWATIMNGASSSNEVPSGVRGICPDGWHISSYAEWDILVNYLEGSGVAGGKMKETGTTHWHSPNTGATNESGFTALPGGYRDDNGDFNDLGRTGYLWSATEYDSAIAWTRFLRYYYGDLHRGIHGKETGFSVRCVRD